MPELFVQLFTLKVTVEDTVPKEHLRHITDVDLLDVVVQWVLALYTFASAQATGVGEGFLTVAINVMAFIFKKIMLAFTDPIGIDSAMLVSGATPLHPP